MAQARIGCYQSGLAHELNENKNTKALDCKNLRPVTMSRSWQGPGLTFIFWEARSGPRNIPAPTLASEKTCLSHRDTDHAVHLCRLRDKSRRKLPAKSGDPSTTAGNQNGPTMVHISRSTYFSHQRT